MVNKAEKQKGNDEYKEDKYIMTSQAFWLYVNEQSSKYLSLSLMGCRLQEGRSHVFATNCLYTVPGTW